MGAIVLRWLEMHVCFQTAIKKLNISACLGHEGMTTLWRGFPCTEKNGSRSFGHPMNKVCTASCGDGSRQLGFPAKTVEEFGKHRHSNLLTFRHPGPIIYLHMIIYKKTEQSAARISVDHRFPDIPFIFYEIFKVIVRSMPQSLFSKATISSTSLSCRFSLNSVEISLCKPSSGTSRYISWNAWIGENPCQL